MALSISEDALVNAVDGEVQIPGADILLQDDAVDQSTLKVSIKPQQITLGHGANRRTYSMEDIFKVTTSSDGTIAKLFIAPQKMSVSDVRVPDRFLDFESQGSCASCGPGNTPVVGGISLTLVAEDDSKLKSEREVILTVTDVNDVSVSSVTITGNNGLMPTSPPLGQEAQITLNGTNFGTMASSGLPAPASVQVKYGSWSDASASFEANAEFSAKDCALAERYSQITCKSGPGVGSGLRWQVCIGTACAISPPDVTSSYDSPRITATEPGVIDSLKTEGGSIINFVGVNFGGTTANVQVTYNVSGVTQQATDCRVRNNNDGKERIECTIGAGAGKNVAFTAICQSSPSAAFGSASYAKPLINSVRPTTELNTQGGSEVTITGANFGPVGTPVRATLSNDGGTTTKGATCEQDKVEPQTKVICTAPAGVGQNYKWTVYIAEQASDESTDASAYQGPTIQTVSGPGAEGGSTRGKLTINVGGNGFGPTSTKGISLVSGKKAAMFSNDAQNTFTSTDCEVVTDDVAIRCNSVAGTGAGLWWKLVVGTGKGARESALFDASNSTSYGVPVIFTISNNLGKAVTDGSTTGGDAVVISGRNFGPALRVTDLGVAGKVTYGPCVKSVTDTASGRVDCAQRLYQAKGCSVTLDHSEIRCRLGVGSGASSKWLLYIDGQRSAAPTTSYSPPQPTLIQTAAKLGTRGGDTITLTGSNFGEYRMLQKLTYGPSGVEFDATETCVQSVYTHNYAECKTVPGFGVDLKVLMRVGPNVSDSSLGQTSALSDDIKISYADPEVKSVLPCAPPCTKVNGPTKGGVVLTVNGSNYGTQGNVQVDFLGQLIAPSRTVISSGLQDESLEFSLPPGCGGGEMRLVVGGTRFSASTPFLYDRPEITNVVQGASASGTNLTIFGSNLGLERVPSSGLPCGRVMLAKVNGKDANGRPTFGTPEPIANFGRITSYSHDKITVLLSGNSGGQVSVRTGTGATDQQVSNNVEFSDFSPVITKWLYDKGTGAVEPPIAEAALPLNSGGGSLIVRGRYFGIGPKVMVGPLIDGAIPQEVIAECVRMDNDELFCEGSGENTVCRACTPAEKTAGQCSSSYGYWRGVKPTRYQKCDPQGASCAEVIDVGNTCFSGGNVYDARQPCTVLEAELKCALPAGQGASYAVVVEAACSEADCIPSRSLPAANPLRYQPPTPDQASVAALQNAPTTGAPDFAIMAMDTASFGTIDNRDMVTMNINIDGKPVTVKSQNRTHVTFALPLGQGVGKKITFSTPSLYCPGKKDDQFASITCPARDAARYSTSRQYDFTYGKPILRSVEIDRSYPVPAGPDATVATRRRLIGLPTAIKIYGDNFGNVVDNIKVFMTTDTVAERSCKIAVLDTTKESEKSKGDYVITSFSCAGSIEASTGVRLRIEVDGRNAPFKSPTLTSGITVRDKAGNPLTEIPTAGEGSTITVEGTGFDNVQQGNSKDVTVGANDCATSYGVSQAVARVWCEDYGVDVPQTGGVENNCTNSKKAGRYFGGKCWNLCTNVKVNLKDSPNTPCATADETCEMTCTVPAGQGKDQAVTVNAGDFRSTALKINYAAPTMWWAMAQYTASISDPDCAKTIKPAKCLPVLLGKTTYDKDADNARWVLGNSSNLRPIDFEYKVSTQGAELNLFGKNLGGFGGKLTMTKKAKSQDLPVVNVADGTYVTTKIPAGAGDGHVLEYSVGGQTSAVKATFSYNAPNVTDTAPKRANTRGGGALRIDGQNFGVNVDDVTVVLGGNCSRPCPVLNVTHTQIFCRVPACQGQGVPIIVTAGGLVSETTYFFDYDKARVDDNRTEFTRSIESVPNVGKVLRVGTSGGSLSDYVTLYGENFGVRGTISIGSCDKAPYQTLTQTICPPNKPLSCQLPISCSDCDQCAAAGFDAEPLVSGKDKDNSGACQRCFDAVPLSVELPGECIARPPSVRNCECEHVTDKIKFQLPADAGFGGIRPISVNIGGVVSVLDISVEYMAPNVTGLALGQDLSSFSTTGQTNGNPFTITIAGSSFGQSFDNYDLPTQFGTGLCAKSREGGVSAEVRVIQPELDVNSFGPGTACTGEAALGQLKPNCSMCTIVRQSHGEIVCQPGPGFGTNLQVKVMRSPPKKIAERVRLDAGLPFLNTTKSSCETDASLCALGEGSGTFNYAPPVLTGFSPNPFDAYRETTSLTLTGNNFGGKPTDVKVTIVGLHGETGHPNNEDRYPCVNAKWNDGGGGLPYITCNPPSYKCQMGPGASACAVGQVQITGRVCLSAIPCKERDPHFQSTIDEGFIIAGHKIVNVTVAEQYTSTFEFTPDAVELPLDNVKQVFKAECKAGYFGNSRARYGKAGDEVGMPLERCTQCKEDRMICSAADIAVPIPKPGWWRQTDATFVANGGERNSDSYGCQPYTRGRASCDVYLPCEPASSCESNNICAKGYQGERCAECAKNSDGTPLYFKLSGECEPCPACPACILLVFLSMAAIAACVCYVFVKRKIALGIFSIGFDYFQVLAVLAASNRVRWPGAVITVFQAFSASNFNLDLMAPECSFKEMSYQTKWALIECMPLFALGIFLCIHFSKWAHKKFVQKRTKKLHNHIHMVIGMSLTAMYYFYLYMTKVSLDIFNCSPTDPPDGHEYLEAVFESCDKPGGVHETLLPWAIVFFSFYTLGYPAIVGLILFKNKERVKEDQLLRALGSGDTRATNPNCHDFRKRFSRLYFHFKPHHFYWILVILTRKFLIACAALVFRRTPVFLLAFILLVLFISYALQVRHQPYMSMSERAGVVAKYEAEKANMDVGVFKAKAQITRKRGREKIRFGEKITRDRAEASIEYFWNYNTVEAVLLFSAFLIVLMGLMFNSDGFQPGSDAESGTQAFTLFVLIFSIIYFMVVLSSELIIGLDVCKGVCRKKMDKFATKLADAEPTTEVDNKMSRADSEIEFAANMMHHVGGASNPAAEQAGQDAMRELGTAHATIEQLQAEVRDLKKKMQAAQLKGYTSQHGSSKRVSGRGSQRKQLKKKTFGDDKPAPIAESPAEASTKEAPTKGKHARALSVESPGHQRQNTTNI
eukprot:g3135.t1